MANFNLNDYETVEQRLARAYKDHPDMRIITKNLTTLQDRQVSTWVVQAEIWLPIWSNMGRVLPSNIVERWLEIADAWYLKATGLAFEVDGVGMANKTSALENAETSAIGRALANAGYSGNKRTTREEMAKVQRDEAPAAPARDWVREAEDLEWKKDIDGLRKLYTDAVRLKAPAAAIERIKALGSSGSQDTPS